MRTLTVLCALSLAVTPVVATPAQAAPVAASSGRAAPAKPTRAKPVVDAALADAWRSTPTVTWPSGQAEVKAAARTAGADRVVAQRAGTLPVWVSGQAHVRLDRMPGGVRLRLGNTGRPTPVEVDYSGFRWAFGGDWSSRLRVVDERTGVAAPTRNDVRAGRLSATLSDGSFAITADASGSAGSFTPTSLSPSATWQVGLSSGDFGWSYPLAVPPMPGQSPTLALTYSSGGVDGRTASTNNQPSPVGEGFDLTTGYIERSYQSCTEDGQSHPDLCWASHNATVVLPGLAGELVRDDATGSWRAEQDDGWRVELLTGATSNGDNDGEYWKLTAPDGTQYFFGRNRMPQWQSGDPDTNSAFTVPVYGDDAGEPCQSTQWCQQAWRWMLDFVVDPHGDAMTYYYDRETNYYDRQGTPTAYVRSGQLARIEYGQRLTSLYATAPGRVVLTPGNRCLAEGPDCVTSKPQNWPDVPLDQACGASACAIPVPTFWSTRRLAKITTQIHVNGAYRDVDSYTLTHAFPDTGDGTSPALWLSSIVHSGHTNGTLSLPPVTFAGVQRENRLDATGGHPVMNKWRVETISTEAGGRIKVTYGLKECQRATLPAPDDNRLKCFPVWWDVTGAGPTLDWFNKYVVTQVAEEDPVGGAPAKLTQYDYLDPGVVLWHHDDAELTPARFQSWGGWRGYARVRVRTGVAGAQTATEYMFLRGLHNDLKADGSRRTVNVDGLEDKPAWRGFARQETVYDGAAVVSRTVSEPTVIGTTATRARGSGTLEATLTDERSVQVVTTLASGGTRTAETRYGYDAAGRLKYVSDLGDVATASDDTCTRTSYAENLTDWIWDRVSREETVGVSCEATARYPDDLLADQRYYYDGNDTWGSPPSRGDRTRVEQAAAWNTYVTVSRATPDGHGRPLESYDATGKLTRTTYTPTTGGPLTRTVVTNPLGHQVATDLEPARGQPVTSTDANGGVTTRGYDAFGRLANVWLPGRTTAMSPNLSYAYLVRADGPSVLTTNELQGAGTYKTTRELFDGLLRPRQTQEASPAGGRIVTDTRYDARGLVERTYGPRHDPSGTGSDLAPTPSTLDSETRYLYDGAGRETAEILLSKGAEKWRTSTAYGGDRVTTTPPAGGITTTQVFDARDRLVELREQSDATRYTYTRAGQLATVTDPAGNVWRYTYDLRGRMTRAEAPDTGVRRWTHDDAGRMITSTDGRGRTLTIGYDDLGRRTSLAEGATRLAQWTYDTATLGKGLLASATRYAGANAYTSAVTGYDVRGRRLGTTVTIPAAETGLAGSYTTSYAYNEADQVTRLVTPAAGGVTAETLAFGYDALGYPTTFTGLNHYVMDSSYDELGDVSWQAFGEYGRQVYRSYERDPATRRLTKATTARDHVDLPTISETSYAYDPAGNVLSIVDAPDGVTADAQCFRYDSLRRMTEAWTSTDCTTPAADGAAAYWHTYTYDVTGNRLSEVRHAATGNTNRTYGYPSGHRLASVTTNGSTASYGYDAAGNQTSAPGRTFSWDAEGHLASTSDSSYVYDADGNRLIRRDAAGVTLYLGDTEVRRATTGAVTTTRHYRFGGGVVAARTGSQLRWLVADHHGTDEISIGDQAGLPATVRRSLPFGGTRGTAPANWPGERSFVGGTQDPTGLIHLGAREYDPATGRFISADPIVDHQDPQQVNGYAYAANNPATFIDADGLKTKKPAKPKSATAKTPTKSKVPPKRTKTKPAKNDGPTNDPWANQIIANMDYDYFLCSTFGITCYPGFEDGAQAMCEWYGCDNLDGSTVWDYGYDGGYDDGSYDPAPSYEYLERECDGWDECITPRPREWQRVDAGYDTDTYSSRSPRWGGICLGSAIIDCRDGGGLRLTANGGSSRVISLDPNEPPGGSIWLASSPGSWSGRSWTIGGWW
ncbi:hypothetical protein ONA91_35265 [Micromonospora sp. DR5-3]|uniref:RHS repeat-associated core domain-containing protein n=1 Tax=unclassified Micromonospora TaxID=2617518 RepID=UPI0011D3F60D|nr:MULTISPECIES: RHS repeat-associated core domain-containing protein [unclassified Micromonospora]MCW3819710.1 hypothetical protein [Micromonospora sp. DR5-3]TYC19660.1 hypothetical protein FXF52_35425 [Micromonospora sp. MP36]